MCTHGAQTAHRSAGPDTDLFTQARQRHSLRNALCQGLQDSNAEPFGPVVACTQPTHAATAEASEVDPAAVDATCGTNTTGIDLDVGVPACRDTAASGTNGLVSG